MIVGFIVLLLVVWAALAIIGAVIKGLLWLTAVAALMFVVTVIWWVASIRMDKSQAKPETES